MNGKVRHILCAGHKKTKSQIDHLRDIIKKNSFKQANLCVSGKTNLVSEVASSNNNNDDDDDDVVIKQELLDDDAQDTDLQVRRLCY